MPSQTPYIAATEGVGSPFVALAGDQLQPQFQSRLRSLPPTSSTTQPQYQAQNAARNEYQRFGSSEYARRQSNYQSQPYEPATRYSRPDPQSAGQAQSPRPNATHPWSGPPTYADRQSQRRTPTVSTNNASVGQPSSTVYQQDYVPRSRPLPDQSYGSPELPPSNVTGFAAWQTQPQRSSSISGHGQYTSHQGQPSFQQPGFPVGIGPNPSQSASVVSPNYSSLPSQSDTAHTLPVPASTNSASRSSRTINGPQWRTIETDSSKINLPLDASYKVPRHGRNFFVVGRVFLVVWSEPAGTSSGTPTNVSTGSSSSTDSLSAWTYNKFGQSVFTKPRRFVVVRATSKYCNAVSINTYGRQGVAKPLVNKADHAVVYTGRTEPMVLPSEAPNPREAGLRPTAIRVDADDPAERLDPTSRIDFGRIYTIAFNTEVKNFGMVNPRSMGALVQTFHEVILGKTPDSKKPAETPSKPTPSNAPVPPAKRSGTVENGGHDIDSDTESEGSESDDSDDES